MQDDMNARHEHDDDDDDVENEPPQPSTADHPSKNHSDNGNLHPRQPPVTKNSAAQEQTPTAAAAGVSTTAISNNNRKLGCCGGRHHHPSQKNPQHPSAIQCGRDLGVWDSSLEDRAGIMSNWLLSYLTPLLKLGSHKVLDPDDIGVPSRQDETENAYQQALAKWQIQSQKARRVNDKLKAKYERKLAQCTTDAQRAKLTAASPQYHHEPSIALSLMQAFGVWQLVLGQIYYVISALLTFAPVIILKDLVKFFESGLPLSEFDGFAPAWVEVLGLAVVPMAVSLLQTRHQAIFAHCAVFVRTAVSTLLYRKALKVSAAARAKTSTGQVVNMMSNDTAQLQRFLQFVGMTVTAPLQIILALFLIYQQVGNATWVGVAFMIFLAPINTIVFSIVSKQRRKVLKYSDLRVKMMNEILAGIRIIKFYAWERPFNREVGTLRGKELEALTKLAYTSAWGFSLILMSAPLIQPILVFLTYVAIQDEPLTASVAFTTVALFNIMRFPFAFLPMGLLQYIQSKISLRRLERYLDLPELAQYVEPTPPPNAHPDDVCAQCGSVTIQNGTFAWIDPDAKPIRPVQDNEPSKKDKRRQSKKRRGSQNSSAIITDTDMRNSAHSYPGSVLSDATPKGPTITLEDISIQIPAGSLVAVVGNVGSGKSSLLSAILGELEPIGESSKVYIPRRPADVDQTGFISYCAQTPWVVNDTLRGNVLFGRDYDEERYEQVVQASALVDDLAVLPAADRTEIGEKGINLSGGQKARVSLARALYSKNTKLMLLDDPLSAVDAHVGEHIFTQAIAGDLVRGVTRILVTHHVHLLDRCDRVVVLEGGRIQHYGTYTELVAQGVDFAGAIDVTKAKIAEEEEEQEEEPVQAGEDKNIHKEATIAVEKPTPEDEAILSDETKAKLQQSGKKLVKDEEREEGSVAGSAYLHYAHAGGYFMAAMTFIIQGIGKGFEVGSSFWLAYWAEEAFTASAMGEPHSKGRTNFFLGIYALFGMMGVVGLTLRSVFIAVHRLHASKKLHDELTERILRAPVAFFDVTPVGRILNRFAADMDKVDLELTQSLSQGISTIFNVLGALAAMIAATNGTFLIPMIPLGYGCYLIQKWFRKTSTELQRITSILNSPIFSDFSQTLSGTSTIRAYGEEQRFFTHCKTSFDTMNAAYLLTQLTNLWLGLRLDVIGGLMGAFIGGVAVATYTSGFISAGWLGLALSYSNEITQYLKHGVRMIATIEAQMNSVERILYYTNNVENEPDEFTDRDPAPGKWPDQGAIELKNASMRYRDGPIVLKDISLKINPGEKIGVCGRTGSGKSSLMVALFRISEIEKDGGMILIDGVNTSEIGTSALRLNISIIPQDPVIFSNTVRYNLDPFGNASDEELWTVLEKVQMAEVVGALPLGLLEEVAEGGENFSQGQRQLLCIARSLLRKPKVLVLDEATSSIDNTTDAAIQQMIRKNFRDATVLTIAHRLNTIMDSDRVLVLSDGRIAEFDSPERLLETEGSLFKAMIDKSRAAKGEL